MLAARDDGAHVAHGDETPAQIVQSNLQRPLPKLFRGPSEALHSGSFALYWAARLLSLLGTQTSRTAIILLLAGNTSAVAAIGALIWCEILPGVAAGFFAGGVVDRAPRRTMMFAADIVRASTLFLAAWHPDVPVLLAIAAINSIASAFFNPARAAALPDVVKPELLTKANAMDQSASTAVLIAGPFLGAIIFFNFGLRWALIADACTFLLSGALLVAALPGAAAAERTKMPMWREIQEGWRYLRHNPLPRTMLVLSAASVLSVGIWMPLAASFVRTFLNAGEGVIAQQLTIFGVGGLCGAPAAAWAARRAGRGGLLAAMLLAEAAAMLLYSRTQNVPLSGFIIFVWGMVVSGITVPFYSLLQEQVPGTHLGRVFAIHEQTENVGGAIAIAGPVAMQQILAPQDIFAVAALFYASAVAFVLRSPGGLQLFKAR